MSDWYTTINSNSLEQGDIIENCRIIMPDEKSYNALLKETQESVETSYVEQTCIILSQSCDLENDKISSVILCPIVSLGKLITQDCYFKSSDAREQLRQGNQPAYHLLDKFSINGEEDFYCVSFHHIFSVPKTFLIASIKGKERIRLVSPYKEHLAQSFARYFMRVGLPSGISREEIKNYGK